MIKEANRSDYGLQDGDAEYQRVTDALTAAVLQVLDSPVYKGRAAHTIHPHIRTSHIYALRTGDSTFGIRRLARVAKALGIEFEMTIRLPEAA